MEFSLPDADGDGVTDADLADPALAAELAALEAESASGAARVGGRAAPAEAAGNAADDAALLADLHHSHGDDVFEGAAPAFAPPAAAQPSSSSSTPAPTRARARPPATPAQPAQPPQPQPQPPLSSDAAAAVERLVALFNAARVSAAAAVDASRAASKGGGGGATPEAARWVGECKALKADIAAVRSGAAAPAAVLAGVAVRAARAERDAGYAELRLALAAHYKGRISVGTELAAQLRAPGLPRDERAELTARYTAVAAEKRASEQVRMRVWGGWGWGC